MMLDRDTFANDNSTHPSYLKSISHIASSKNSISVGLASQEPRVIETIFQLVFGQMSCSGQSKRRCVRGRSRLSLMATASRRFASVQSKSVTGNPDLHAHEPLLHVDRCHSTYSPPLGTKDGHGFVQPRQQIRTILY
jgi:hypothetical protein